MSKPFLLNEYELSDWAFDYCYAVDDDPEIRRIITRPIDSFKYCKYIKDDPEIVKNIVCPYVARIYCEQIRYDPEVAKNFKEVKYNG